MMRLFYSLAFFVAGLALFSSLANADKNILGYTKVPPSRAMNDFTYQVQGGLEESTPTPTDSDTWKGFYLAFAIEKSYFADCSAAAKSALCTFFRSSIALSGDFTWSEKSKSEKYQVILVPIEFVSGKFGKEGLDLRNTGNAFYFTFGFSAEYIRDLGLKIQNKVNALVNTSLNYSNVITEIDENSALRWIGSAKFFMGSSIVDANTFSPEVGVAAGIEAKTGLALDLKLGTISLVYSGKIQGDGDFSKQGYRSVLSTNGIELRYLHSVCVHSAESPTERDCKMPRQISVGGGVRYEYSTYNFDLPTDKQKIDESFHRLIFFFELSRF